MTNPRKAIHTRHIHGRPRDIQRTHICCHTGSPKETRCCRTLIKWIVNTLACRNSIHVAYQGENAETRVVKTCLLERLLSPLLWYEDLQPVSKSPMSKDMTRKYTRMIQWWIVALAYPRGAIGALPPQAWLDWNFFFPTKMVFSTMVSNGISNAPPLRFLDTPLGSGGETLRYHRKFNGSLE